MATLAVISSGNRKTGPMGAVYRTQTTCPTSCTFYSNGCYADGRTFAIPRKFGDDDLDFQFKKLRRQLPLHGALRLNVSGDFLTEDGTPDWAYIAACNQLVKARPDIRVIAYTHAWRELDRSIFVGFIVNASCETPADAEEAIDAGWQAVLVDDGSSLSTVVAGKRVVQCPEETRGVQCIDCMACSADKRTRPIIAFTPHGSSLKKAVAALEQVRQRPARKERKTA